MRYVAAVAISIAAALIAPASAHGQSSVSGVIREDSTGNPVPGAEVSIEKAKRRTIADSTGHYFIGKVPSGLHQVRVRRLGYLPTVTMIRIGNDERREADLTVERAPAELDPVTINALARTATSGGPGFSGFEDRRKLGFGLFFDSTHLRKNEFHHLEDVLRTAVGVKVVEPPMCEDMKPCGKIRSRRVAVNGRAALGNCAMEVVLNNAIVTRGKQLARNDDDWGATFDLNDISASNLDAMEIYRSASEVPPQYGGGNLPCGVLVLWLRRTR